MSAPGRPLETERRLAPRTLLRYVLDEFLRNFGLALAGLVIVLTVANVFDELSRVLRHDPPLWAALWFVALKTPYHLVASVPLAVLLGTLFTLARFLRTHELIAMRAAGLSQFAIAGPFLGVALVTSLGMIVVDETVLPWANAQRDEIKRVYIQKLPQHEWLTAAKAAIWTGDGKLVFAQQADGEAGVLKGVTILEFAGRTPVARTDAVAARPVPGAWRLTQAQTYRWVGGRPVLSLDATAVVPLREDLASFLREEVPPDAQTAAELHRTIARLKSAGKDFRREQVYYDFKWAFPFASVIIGLLGLAISFTFQTNPRAGTAMAFGVAVVTALIYVGLVQLGQTLGVGGVLPPLLSVWLANLVFLAVGVGLLWRAWRR